MKSAPDHWRTFHIATTLRIYRYYVIILSDPSTRPHSSGDGMNASTVIVLGAIALVAFLIHKRFNRKSMLKRCRLEHAAALEDVRLAHILHEQLGARTWIDLCHELARECHWKEFKKYLSGVTSIPEAEAVFLDTQIEMGVILAKAEENLSLVQNTFFAK